MDARRDRRPGRQVRPERGTVTGGRLGGDAARAADRRAQSYRGRRAGRGRFGGIAFLLILAAVVLVSGLTIVGPALGGFARGLAQSNPETLRVPFMADLVRGQLGTALSTPASTEPEAVEFVVQEDATADEIADDLVGQKLIKDRLVFHYLLVTKNAGENLQAGTFTLDRSMTPEQIVERLQRPPDPVIPKIAVPIREGLRLEQVAALLESLDLEMDVREFLQLARRPPAELRKEYRFLAVVPENASLEGFIPAGTYAVPPSITPEDLLRRFLDEWEERVGMELVAAAEEKGKDFYEVLTLASIVEREATLPRERRLIAGVYTNRLERLEPPLLNADPTVFYAYDSGKLKRMPIEQWVNYAFWVPPGIALAEIDVPKELEAYQTYRRTGLPPAPICTPTRGSIEAALDPDTKPGYLYFVAKNDASKSHVFARTLVEHRRNVRKYQQ